MWVRVFDIVSIPIATDDTGIVEASKMPLMYRMNNVDWELMFVLLHWHFKDCLMFVLVGIIVWSTETW